MSQLSHSLDLNTLHALSRTCRRFRHILLQVRDSLIEQTLRCEYDVKEYDSDHSGPGSPSGGPERSNEAFQQVHDRLASGKIGPCARDLVGDCQRCGVIICRVGS